MDVAQRPAGEEMTLSRRGFPPGVGQVSIPAALRPCCDGYGKPFGGYGKPPYRLPGSPA